MKYQQYVENKILTALQFVQISFYFDQNSVALFVLTNVNLVVVSSNVVVIMYFCFQLVAKITVFFFESSFH